MPPFDALCGGAVSGNSKNTHTDLIPAVGGDRPAFIAASPTQLPDAEVAAKPSKAPIVTVDEPVPPAESLARQVGPPVNKEALLSDHRSLNQRGSVSYDGRSFGCQAPNSLVLVDGEDGLNQLEAENKQLKALLAEKLRAENVLLKEMLTRTRYA